MPSRRRTALANLAGIQTFVTVEEAYSGLSRQARRAEGQKQHSIR